MVPSFVAMKHSSVSIIYDEKDANHTCILNSELSKDHLRVFIHMKVTQKGRKTQQVFAYFQKCEPE